ncbi:MAG TPA: hypothetical protein VF771_06390 [Longimicrobiaceae bacterium]
MDDYDRSVFINCPFDSDYAPIFHAIIFAVLDCGFHARSALEIEDSGEVRIRKIKRIIRECRYGIHDISRVQLEAANGLPRYNMALELGLFLGAQEYGPGKQKLKRSLILDSERWRYQQFCSDIAGQDIRAHGNDPERAIAAVRAMLATAAGGTARIPGPALICDRYARFQHELPALCRALHVHPSELQFVELRSLMAAWLKQHLLPD